MSEKPIMELTISHWDTQAFFLLSSSFRVCHEIGLFVLSFAISVHISALKQHQAQCIFFLYTFSITNNLICLSNSEFYAIVAQVFLYASLIKQQNISLFYLFNQINQLNLLYRIYNATYHTIVYILMVQISSK